MNGEGELLTVPRVAALLSRPVWEVRRVVDKVASPVRVGSNVRLVRYADLGAIAAELAKRVPNRRRRANTVEAAHAS